MIGEWDRHQQNIASWKAAIMPPSLNTARGEYDRSLEEFKELDVAIAMDNGTKAAAKEIGSEAVDVVIRMLGIASIVGCNMASSLDEKITETTTRKYPPDQIRRSMESGMTWPEAMGHAKIVWQSKRPI